MTAWVRSRRPSLWSIRLTWVLMVSSPRNMRLAVALGVATVLLRRRDA
jgi:hypothetical protein